MATQEEQPEASGPQNADDGNATSDPKIERNRSAVRMFVTYMAAGFLFSVGAALAGYFVATGAPDDGKDVFFGILPVAAAVITYWFATRRSNDDVVQIIKAMRDQT